MAEDKPLRARTTGAGGFELRCAALQGVPCLEFKGTGDCEHTRAVLVKETGGLVTVLDALREELREAQVEIAALRLAQRFLEEERDIAQTEAMEAQEETAALRPLAHIMGARLAVPGEQLAASFGHFEEESTTLGGRALSSADVLFDRLFEDDGESP